VETPSEKKALLTLWHS